LLDEPYESSDNDIRIIKLLEGLSESYWKQVAKYAQAEPVCERLLKLAISRLGLDHPDSAAAVNNLGLVLLRQEKYAKAASSFSQAQALYRK